MFSAMIVVVVVDVDLVHLHLHRGYFVADVDDGCVVSDDDGDEDVGQQWLETNFRPCCWFGVVDLMLMNQS